MLSLLMQDDHENLYTNSLLFFIISVSIFCCFPRISENIAPRLGVGLIFCLWGRGFAFCLCPRGGEFTN